jgi:hypothetical protein
LDISWTCTTVDAVTRHCVASSDLVSFVGDSIVGLFALCGLVAAVGIALVFTGLVAPKVR